MTMLDKLRSRLLSPEDEARIERAIGLAEAGHRGEIRVHVERRCPAEPVDRAREWFGRLGMQKTREGTAVLLYVAVDDRKTAVFAGAGIHAAAEPGFWQDVADAVAAGAKKAELASGIAQALALIGEKLLAHAPGEDAAGNELPDKVSAS